MNKIGFLLPAYNEEKNIGIVIDEIKKYVPNSKILVVDDGSKDKTSEIAKIKGVRVIRHKKNKGKGEALTTGFTYFSKQPNIKVIVILDTDRQYTAKDTLKIVSPLLEGKADYVTGYRNWKEVPRRHSLGNFVWRNTFNLLFGTKLKDTNCGFIAMTTEAMKKMMKITYGGYIIENMMLAEALKNNFRIKQVPVKVYYHYIRSIPGGSRIVLGCWIFIIKRALQQRFRIKL